MSLSFLSWIDNRTILGCLILLTFTFAVVFLGLRRMHPQMRGSKDFSLGYFCGLIGCCLISSRSTVPYMLSVVLGNTLVFCCYAFIYRGILRFFHKSRPLYPIWITIALSSLPLIWYSVVHDNIVPRIVVISLVYTLLRGLTALELFRNSAGKPLIRIFACFMSLYALSSLNRAVFCSSPKRHAGRRDHLRLHHCDLQTVDAL